MKITSFDTEEICEIECFCTSLPCHFGKEAYFSESVELIKFSDWEVIGECKEWVSFNEDVNFAVLDEMNAARHIIFAEDDLIGDEWLLLDDHGEGFEQFVVEVVGQDGLLHQDLGVGDEVDVLLQVLRQRL